MSLPKTLFELEQKMLNEHHDHYVAFTRLILSLAVGSFALLATFRGNLISNESYVLLSNLTYPLLLVSILAGILVQHRIMMNPLWQLRVAKSQAEEAENKGDPSSIELRRKPSRLEQWFYRLQIGSFSAAYLVLAAHVYQSYAV